MNRVHFTIEPLNDDFTFKIYLSNYMTHDKYVLLVDETILNQNDITKLFPNLLLDFFLDIENDVENAILNDKLLINELKDYCEIICKIEIYNKIYKIKLNVNKK